MIPLFRTYTLVELPPPQSLTKQCAAEGPPIAESILKYTCISSKLNQTCQRTAILKLNCALIFWVGDKASNVPKLPHDVPEYVAASG